MLGSKPVHEMNYGKDQAGQYTIMVHNNNELLRPHAAYIQYGFEDIKKT